MILAIFSAHGEETKIRVLPNEIWIDEHGIFIHSEGDWVPVAALYSDSLGLYAEKDSRAEDDVGIIWSCGKCGRWNWGGSQYCRHCGKQR